MFEDLQQMPLKEFPELEAKTPCSMCGKCCEAIALEVSMEQFKADSYRYRDSYFIIKNWKVMDKETALSINPNLISPRGDLHYYSCDKYDAASKLCTAHDDRPRVCSGFPFYGNDINNVALRMHLECSIWADVPVEYWPSGVNI